MASDIEIVRTFAAEQPIDLDGVFFALGIEYEEKPLGVQSGWIEYVDGAFGVVVNSDESLQRKRFTAAHELGHYLLHRDILMSSGRLNRHTDILFGDNKVNNETIPFTRMQETQANRAAAEILMPADYIIKKSQSGVDALKDYFQVSRQAMEIRFSTLGLSV